ncbi:MAG: hypothetical protein WC269_00015 [Candidatus Gracilibacteria bacterium]
MNFVSDVINVKSMTILEEFFLVPGAIDESGSALGSKPLFQHRIILNNRAYVSEISHNHDGSKIESFFDFHDCKHDKLRRG